MINIRYIQSIITLWFRVSRPILYPLIPLVFLLGYQSSEKSLMSLSMFEWIFVFVLTWPVSMIIYGINDISDHETDRVIQTRNNIDGAVIDFKLVPSVWLGVTFATILLFGVGYTVYGVYGLCFALLVFVASCLYSLPPVRIKSRPLLDGIFSGIVYAGCMYTSGYIVAMDQLAWPPVVAYILIMFAMSLHALGTLRDYTADRIARHNTLAVVFGPRATAGLISSICLAGIIWWYQERGFDFVAGTLFLSILLPALLSIRKLNEYFIQKSLYVIVCIGIIAGITKILS